MEEENIAKTSDPPPEDLQSGTSELSGKREDGASEETYVTYHRQRKHIMDLQEQLDECRHVLDCSCQDLEKSWSDIEYLNGSIKDLHIIIKELWFKNHDLAVQLQKAMMSGGEQIAQAVEEDKEPSLDVHVQTKSWWRRQLKKVVKGMGTFRLRLMRCLGVKASNKPVARLINVQPASSPMSTMDIIMQSMSVAMPPVSD